MKLKLDIKEIEELEYLLSYIKQNPGGLSRDYPIPFERELFDTLVTQFDSAFADIEFSLFEEGLLTAIMETSYNPQTGSYDLTLFQQLFEKHFNTMYERAIESDTQELLDLVWEESHLESSGSGSNSDDVVATTAIDQLGSYLVKGAVVGAVGQILLNSVQSLLNKGGGLSTMLARFRDSFSNLVLERRKNYYNLLSAILINRTRNFGRVFGYRNAGYTSLIWNTISDSRTCPRCDLLDGTEFQIEHLVTIINNFSEQLVYEDAINVTPFPAMMDGNFILPNGGSVPATSSGDVLAQNGIGCPPLHGNCRCELVGGL